KLLSGVSGKGYRGAESDQESSSTVKNSPDTNGKNLFICYFVMLPVLLLHGALGAKSQLNDLASTLDRQGWRTLTMNFSGHNREPYRDDFGIEVFAEDVVQFLAREKIDSAHIFGYSMGGYVAL